MRNPGIHPRQPIEAARRETGAGQQHQRERDLRRDQHAAETAPPARGSAVAAHVFQEDGEVGTRRHDRRGETEDEPRDERQPETEEQNADVHLHGAGARQIGGRDGHQRPDAPRAEQQPGGAAGQREHHAFRQQLAHQAPAPGAEGGAHRDFARSRRRAREQQVRDVDARDQQHEADRAEQDPERPLIGLRHRVQQRLHADRIAGDPRGKAAGDVLLDPIEVLLRLRDRHTVAQPGHGADVVRAALVVGVGLLRERERHPQLGVVRKVESRGHHAGDFIALAFQRDRAADDTWIAAVDATPHAVADEHDRPRPRTHVVFGETPAEQRLHAQRRQHLRVDRHAVQAQRLERAGQGQRLLVVAAERLERSILRLPVAEIRRRDGGGPAARQFVHVHDARGVAVRQRLQEHLLDHRENRRVGADAERGGEHRGQREAGRLAEHPDGKHKILSGHGGPRAGPLEGKTGVAGHRAALARGRQGAVDIQELDARARQRMTGATAADQYRH